MNMQTPVISMANLSVAFFGRTVLNGIDLEIPGNSITIIIGPSGSGKTTLLRAVNRLNEEFAGCSSSGTVRIEVSGTMVDIYADLHLSKLRRVAGMVFQSPNVFPLSIRKTCSPLSRSCIPSAALNGMNAWNRHLKPNSGMRFATGWMTVADTLGRAAATPVPGKDAGAFTQDITA